MTEKHCFVIEKMVLPTVINYCNLYICDNEYSFLSYPILTVDFNLYVIFN